MLRQYTGTHPAENASKIFLNIPFALDVFIADAKAIILHHPFYQQELLDN
jgi:hypothetical protein